MGTEDMPKQPATPDQLAAAVLAKDGAFVDAALSDGVTADSEPVRRWARPLVNDEDPDLRDIAVSVFEAGSLELGDRLRGELITRMMSDENPVVKARAAFALFKHGDRNTPEVLNAVRVAKYSDDEKLRAAATDYLDLLQTRKPDQA